MTAVGSGGVQLKAVARSSRFSKDYKSLDSNLKNRVEQVLRKLLQNPMPPGIAFEKLKGYHNPNIYTVHVTGNFKISLEIDGNKAFLRRVTPHDIIDSNP